MTPKESLRERFMDILNDGDLSDCLLEPLLAAVDEVMAKPVHITITPSDEQLEQLRKAFQEASKATWAYMAYGCTCGAAKILNAETMEKSN